MNFRDARDLAAEYGAKVPFYDWNHPIAGCWIDRIEFLPIAAARGRKALREAIAEADRYCGR